MMIEKVFSVYGYNLPAERSDFSARRDSPVTVRQIIKEYGSYNKFKAAYNAYCVAERNRKVPKVTKKEETDAKQELSGKPKRES